MVSAETGLPARANAVIEYPFATVCEFASVTFNFRLLQQYRGKADFLILPQLVERRGPIVYS